MWSFIISVLIFVVLVGSLWLWQRKSRRTTKAATAVVDEQINASAEVAQRRHVERFGRASTDLVHTLNGAGHAHIK